MFTPLDTFGRLASFNAIVFSYLSYSNTIIIFKNYITVLCFRPRPAESHCWGALFLRLVPILQSHFCWGHALHKDRFDLALEHFNRAPIISFHDHIRRKIHACEIYWLVCFRSNSERERSGMRNWPLFGFLFALVFFFYVVYIYQVGYYSVLGITCYVIGTISWVRSTKRTVWQSSFTCQKYEKWTYRLAILPFPQRIDFRSKGRSRKT